MRLNLAGCRELVVAALAQHDNWTVSNAAETTADQSNYTSLMVWAEYERIDWEQVYAGVRTACAVHPHARARSTSSFSSCTPLVHKVSNILEVD